MEKDTLLSKVVEITVARMSNTSMPVNSDSGKATAEFMQEIYNKLVELNVNHKD